MEPHRLSLSPFRNTVGWCSGDSGQRGNRPTTIGSLPLTPDLAGGEAVQDAAVAVEHIDGLDELDQEAQDVGGLRPGVEEALPDLPRRLVDRPPRRPRHPDPQAPELSPRSGPM